MWTFFELYNDGCTNCATISSYEYELVCIGGNEDYCAFQYEDTDEHISTECYVKRITVYVNLIDSTFEKYIEVYESIEIRMGANIQFIETPPVMILLEYFKRDYFADEHYEVSYPENNSSGDLICVS